MKELTQKEKFEVNHDMSLIDGEWQLNVNDYYDKVFSLGIILFRALICCISDNIELADIAFQRPKTFSTLRFNYYPKQDKPVEISSQDGVALGCETHVDSGIMTILYQDKKGGGCRFRTAITYNGMMSPTILAHLLLTVDWLFNFLLMTISRRPITEF